MTADDGPPPEGRAFEGESVRERLVAALRHDLLGPEAPDEVLSQSPGSRYLVGMLAPRGTAPDPLEDERLDAESSDDGEGGEVTAPSFASLDPSSIGLSCVVEDGTKTVTVQASWGEYAEASEDGGQTRWQRTPKEFTVQLPVRETDELERAALEDGVVLDWIAERLDDSLVISLFLVNDREAPADGRPPAELWIYQPELRLTAPGAGFPPRTVARDIPDPDPDLASANLIYRSRREFASGHGVAVDWTTTADGGRATELKTVVVPTVPVPLVEARGAEELAPFDMDVLASADADQAAATLDPLLDAYERWIEARESEVEAIPRPDDAVAAEHVRLARESLERMRHGVELLSEDADALAAFRFANAAMAKQLRHTASVRAKRRNETPSDVPPAWRPFQIGFILLCLRGIADPLDDDRSLADLLWFPTGGGKTEAYLGLTAFTLAYRRLRAADDDFDHSAGTSVLMRYTLRLLTIQQFSRALTLMCACEAIREQAPKLWGSERFTVGLWVGQSATPNSYEASRDALQRLEKGQRTDRESPYQVLYCPWCGDDIAPGDYVCDNALQRTLIKCPNTHCEFGATNTALGLPVLVVDDEIYRHPPSLLIATVDKFAQMAWKGRIQALFGRVDRRCPRHGFLTAAEDHPKNHRETPGHAAVQVEQDVRQLAPPDLVIQDELHLISGPLGTLVGLYEAAVEGLSAREVDGERVVPKVIASTATIRRAGQQVRALFAREVSIFPPLGLDAGDSFFAREAPDAQTAGRLYVGVHAPGKSIKTALVRVYAAMLSRARAEYDANPSAEADAYMTLIGYFNSLRELGGALRLVEDDVPARLRVLDRRSFGPQRILYEKNELTSRKQSSEIPETLKQLDRTFDAPESGAYPLDVLLASNMISVGVDVDRLGLMVVSAQPKTSAEYIQATSRVGRKHPGLVIEVFNWSRPRDISHYEQFRHYHETFYRHVEATSVTPFSARARDRALRGVLAAYARLDGGSMAGETDAARFSPEAAPAQRILRELTERAGTVTDREEVAQQTELQLRSHIEEWGDLAAGEAPLVYTGRGQSSTNPLAILLRRMEQPNARGAWAASGSLREVEPEIDVVLREDADE